MLPYKHQSARRMTVTGGWVHQ